MRLMDASGDMEDMRVWLYERLKREKEQESIMDTIAHSSNNFQALLLTTKSIPCILHSEIRIVIKILTMIFCTVINNPDSKKEQEAFFGKLSKLVNKKVLGIIRSPAQWVVPVTKKKKRKMKMILGVSKLAI
jgi:hypothetical protein